MKNCRNLPLLWVILSLLAATENGQSLLSDPYYEELMKEQAASNLEFNGATAEARASGCHFKEAFRGSWFQSGIHHSITITRDAISTKGHCVEKEGEKYLMYNRRDNCYRCLVFSEKHLNVLQYKETFCISEKRSLQQICSTITGDANLYAMFRLDAVPIDCPFKGRYTVSYNRGYGDCEYPESMMESCTTSSKLVFNYQACPDIPGTESSVETVQCLAGFKEGSSRFFLGLISYQHHASYEERFRCFVYEKIKHGHGRGEFAHHNSHSTKLHSHSSNNSSREVFRVAQSGDATCNGMELSSMEGSRMMTLKKVHPLKPCEFPSWISDHSHWHTLDQGSTYNFVSGNLHISNFSELAGTGPNSITMNAACSQVLLEKEKEAIGWEPDYSPTSVVILHATSDCKTGYICAAFHHRDDNIMEIQFGSIARRTEEACQLSHFNSSAELYVTLVSSIPERIPCPNVGHFQVTGLSWNGKRVGPDGCRRRRRKDGIADLEDVEEEAGETPETETETGGPGNGNANANMVAVGCSAKDSIQVRAKSTCDTGADVMADYNCHGWWSDGKGITYVVTSRSSSHQSFRPQRHCFAFRDLSWTWGRAEKQRVKAGVQFHPTPEDFDEENVDGQLDPTNNRNNNGKAQLLEFSSFADSCRRNVLVGLDGDFAFNLTRLGHCSDISLAPRPAPELCGRIVILVSVAAVVLSQYL